jgi:hypothetical protein
MKNLFSTLIIGVILIATQSTAAVAQPAALGKETNQKQKVRIVVVEKKEGPGGSTVRKPRPENRDRKP